MVAGLLLRRSSRVRVPSLPPILNLRPWGNEWPLSSIEAKLMGASHATDAGARARPNEAQQVNMRKAVRPLRDSDPNASIARERLRRGYRPDRVRILFVGEGPPASGRFFYQADSGLYRAVKDTFISTFPTLRKPHFLESFRALSCYLVDLCGQAVDRMDRRARQRVCFAAEAGLKRTLRQLRPKIVVTVVRSISRNVRRAEDQAGWSGLHVELPYPGRWLHHRTEFRRNLALLLLKSVPSIPHSHG